MPRKLSPQNRGEIKTLNKQKQGVYHPCPPPLKRKKKWCLKSNGKASEVKPYGDRFRIQKYRDSGEQIAFNSYPGSRDFQVDGGFFTPSWKWRLKYNPSRPPTAHSPSQIMLKCLEELLIEKIPSDQMNAIPFLNWMSIFMNYGIWMHSKNSPRDLARWLWAVCGDYRYHRPLAGFVRKDSSQSTGRWGLFSSNVSFSPPKRRVTQAGKGAADSVPVFSPAWRIEEQQQKKDEQRSCLIWARGRDPDLLWEKNGISSQRQSFRLQRATRPQGSLCILMIPASILQLGRAKDWECVKVLVYRKDRMTHSNPLLQMGPWAPVLCLLSCAHCSSFVVTQDHMTESG